MERKYIKKRLRSAFSFGYEHYLTYRRKKELKKMDYRPVDFLISGVQKSGTTWIYEKLQQIDGVFLPRIIGSSDPTETRFFQKD